MSREEPFPLHVALQGTSEMQLGETFSSTSLFCHHPGHWLLTVGDHRLAAHSRPSSPPAASGFGSFLVGLRGSRPPGLPQGLQHPEALAARVSQVDEWLENSVLEMFVPACMETQELTNRCQKDRNSNRL